jgi:hypothetical protein
MSLFLGWFGFRRGRVITAVPRITYVRTPLNRHSIECFTTQNTRERGSQNPIKQSSLNYNIPIFTMNPVRKFRKRNTLTGTFKCKLFYEFALSAAMTITLHVGPIRDTGSWYKPRPDTSDLTRIRPLFLSQSVKKSCHVRV